MSSLPYSSPSFSSPDIGAFFAPFAGGLSLNACGLSMRYGFRNLFEGLDFEIKSGEVMQISGANGAGKSTLMRILAGFMPPDAGTITYRGAWEQEGACAFTHYHGHKDGLRGALTMRENLRFGMDLLGSERFFAQKNQCFDEIFAFFGIKSLLDLPVAVLSAGQRRRVALAKLLLIPRPFWLLDEPLAALDVAGQAAVAQLIAAHAKAGGMVILATHQALSIPTKIIDLDGFVRHNHAEHEENAL